MSYTCIVSLLFTLLLYLPISDDEAYNSSEDNDCTEDCSGTDIDSSLADSGYNGPSPLSHESRCYFIRTYMYMYMYFFVTPNLLCYYKKTYSYSTVFIFFISLSLSLSLSPLSLSSFRSSSLDDLRGADALLCLANIVGETQPLDVKEATVSHGTSTACVRRSTRTGKVF